MATGTLITESLRSDAVLDIPLVVRRVERVEPANLSAEQTAAGLPATWTLLHFAVDDGDAPRLAEELASALDEFGWYADFHTAAESFVVFAGRVFRYPAGDAAGRAEAQAHGRRNGVADAQLDW